MTIQWLGQSCFKITVKSPNSSDTIIMTDPFSNTCGLKKLKNSADIITIHNDQSKKIDYKSIKGTQNTPQPFIIKGPGEFETNNIFVYGAATTCDNDKNKKKEKNTIYLIRAEHMNIAHLGNICQKELTPKQLEIIEDADILLIPVGNKETINAKEANQIVSQVEPRVIIPMRYKIPGLKIDLDDVNKFIKETGHKQEELDKLKITKKDLPQEETKLIVLKS